MLWRLFLSNAPIFQNEELLQKEGQTANNFYRYDVVDTKPVESDQTTLFFAAIAVIHMLP